MIRAFVDASVLFAASYSAEGASREILRLAVSGAVVLVVSDVVKAEVRRNLAKKAPELVPLFEELLAQVPFEEVVASETAVRDAWQQTELKDAPIVAAALEARADFLVTLDKVHLIDPPLVAARAGIPIVLPRVLLNAIRAEREL